MAAEQQSAAGWAADPLAGAMAVQRQDAECHGSVAGPTGARARHQVFALIWFGC